MEYSSLFLLCVIPSIMLYGVAKSGLGGSLSLISIPLMTIVMPLSQALAIILPILILSDIVAVYKFRKQFDLDTVKLMTIGGGIGVAIGSLTYTYFSESLIKFLIGLMGFLFTTHYFIFKRKKLFHLKNLFLRVELHLWLLDLQVFVLMLEELLPVFTCYLYVLKKKSMLELGSYFLCSLI